MTDAPDRPGPNDLVTPFVFVPHGAPDPVAWKRAHPGWVSFPATFVPHKRPIPKWTVLNGKRWPLDKRGQPWPRNRFGQPMCPLDEFPPGMPAPGTQGVYLRERAEAERKLIEGGSYDVAGYLAGSARLRTGREARAASAPAAYPDNGWGAARAYLAWSGGMAAQGREAAGAARQRDAANAQPVLFASVMEPTGEAHEATARVELPEIVVTAKRPEDVDTADRAAAGFGSGAAEAFRDAAEDAWGLAKAAERFATDGAFRREVAESAARLAEHGREMATFVLQDPLGAARSVMDGGQSLYDRFQAAREQARQNGNLTEFDSRFFGRVAAEGAMAFLPFGAIVRAGKTARLGTGAEFFKGAADNSSSPVLKGNPYHPDSVEARLKPEYRPNDAHNTFSSHYNPLKTPEPPDAKDVYSKSVLAEMGT